MKFIDKAIILIMLAFVSCRVADSDKEFGIALIYMPQASIQSGGADNKDRKSVV